jgi:ribonuclease R
MVNKNEIVNYMRKAAYRPLTEEELFRVFGVTKRGSKRFKKLLQELETEGLIYRTRAARYGLPEKMNLAVGRLQGNPRGFGFLICDDRQQPDVFVPASGLNGAMHGDRVVVRVSPGRNGKREGEVVKILHRANARVVGTFQRRQNYGYVVCDEPRLPHDVFIPRGQLNGAQTGDKVVAAITAWPDKRRGPAGRIVEVLGPADAPGMDLVVLCRRFGLPDGFPDRVQAAAAQIPGKVIPQDLEGRRDLRDWTIVTIDGEDAKDLDDAVSLTSLPGGLYRLGVHIADVGYYVPEGSPLDQEALERGTSVYLPGMVIPMLPERLSNGICSLNPGVDRLALSVLMDIDRGGEVIRYEVFPSVIRTVARLTYTTVRQILADGDEEMRARYRELVPMLCRMKDLALVLRTRRFRRGAIDFNLPETKVILDARGRVADLVKVERTVAEQLIEEFMLLTNEVVARHLHRLEVPFLYRVHEKPDGEKLEGLQVLLQTLGYSIPGFPRVRPGALQHILDQVAGKKEERLVNAVTLRAMQQAHYSMERLGHFGLASRDYTHFTSPIRRYPDLVNHRILREVLAGGGAMSEKRKQALQNILPAVAQHASERERRAVEAEREAVDGYKVAYMQNLVGESFPGIISGVTNFGMFVELENTVEGMVSLTSMTDDYYLFDPAGFRLVGQRTRKVYRLGDQVTVKVVRASVAERQIDFVLAEAEP